MHIKVQILFYKRSNHAEAFRAVKNNHKNLRKVSSLVQSTNSNSLTALTNYDAVNQSEEP